MDKIEFLEQLIEVNALKFGNFTLASGDTSPYYLDLRYLPAFPHLFQQLIHQMKEDIASDLQFDIIIGIPSAGTPFGTALAMIMDKPLQLLRKKPKEHGLGRQIEGPDISGKKVLLVDDLISSGYSKEFALEAINKEGGEVEDVIVLVDRSEGKATEWAEKANVRLHALFELLSSEILEFTD